MKPIKKIKYTVDKANGMMPNQAFGRLYFFRYYFRARHGYWDLSIGLNDGSCVRGVCIASGGQNDSTPAESWKDKWELEPPYGEMPGWWGDNFTQRFVSDLLSRQSLLRVVWLFIKSRRVKK